VHGLRGTGTSSSGQEHTSMSSDNPRQREEDARQRRAIDTGRRMDQQARLQRASNEQRRHQRERQHQQELERWRQTEESRRSSRS
jgi:hypothetical protein